MLKYGIMVLTSGLSFLAGCLTAIFMFKKGWFKMTPTIVIKPEVPGSEKTNCNKPNFSFPKALEENFVIRDYEETSARLRKYGVPLDYINDMLRKE